jgi:uncharacterized protein (TIGR02265 family)
MPSSKDEMARRIALATPVHTVRGFTFNGVLRLVAERAGQGEADGLREEISKRPLVDFFNYPAAGLVRLLFEGADLLEPSFGNVDAAIRASGAAAMTAFFAQGVGKTLLSIVGRNDPKRLFANAPTAYSTAVNYGVREFQSLGEKQVRLQFHGDMQPIAFHEGLLTCALNAVGCEGTVEGKASELDVSEYLIRWR